MGFISDFLRKLGVLGEAPYKQLSAKDAENLRRTDKSVQFLDVRTAEEHKQGHIPGSKLSNVMDPSFEKGLKGLSKEKPLVVYCRSGSRSAYAARMLKKLGYENLYNMQGGYVSWKRHKG